VLIVEDDPTLAGLLVSALDAEGIPSRAAASSERALDLIGRMSFAVLVLDVGLPGVDGLELCRRLRRGGLRTPVLAISARGVDPDEVLAAGADAFLAKPFSLTDLLARLCELARLEGDDGDGTPSQGTLGGGVVAAVGPAAGAVLRRAPGRLAPLGGAVVQQAARAVLVAAPGWRAARAGGARGRVALVVHGEPRDPEGLLSREEVVQRLARVVARRLDRERLAAALAGACRGLAGPHAALAACEAEPGSIAVLRHGRSLLAARGDRSVIVASEVTALPLGLSDVRLLSRDGLSHHSPPQGAGGWRRRRRPGEPGARPGPRG
jgi:DNA-binding response OmpR family regulator